MYEHSKKNDQGGFDLNKWMQDMRLALGILDSVESDEFRKSLGVFRKDEELNAHEKKQRSYIASVSYLEGFDTRLQLLSSFANRMEERDKEKRKIDLQNEGREGSPGSRKDNKVEHVFATILNGIRSALEVTQRFTNNPKEIDGLSPKLQQNFKNNFITPVQARNLVMRAILHIKKQGWDKSSEQMRELWERKSEWVADNSGENTNWSGGGELLGVMLGSAEKPWNPFVELEPLKPRE